MTPFKALYGHDPPPHYLIWVQIERSQSGSTIKGTRRDTWGAQAPPSLCPIEDEERCWQKTLRRTLSIGRFFSAQASSLLPKIPIEMKKMRRCLVDTMDRMKFSRRLEMWPTRLNWDHHHSSDIPCISAASCNRNHQSASTATSITNEWAQVNCGTSSGTRGTPRGRSRLEGTVEKRNLRTIFRDPKSIHWLPPWGQGACLGGRYW